MFDTHAQPTRELLEWLDARRGKMLETLARLVQLESPSHGRQALNRLGDFISDQFEELGGRPTIHRQRQHGDVLQFDFAANNAASKPVLLLGHYDTVWDLNTTATMPFRLAEGRAYGPGVFDMKAGIAMMLYAIAALQCVRSGLPRAVTVLLNPDEEIGSPCSRAITQELARRAAAVLVLEPAQGPHGAVKTARKGVGVYALKVTGVGAHAGLDFDKGQSAILELARQVQRVSEFTDLRRGLTVNVGVVRGGTRSNVVAAEASAEVDVRIAHAADAGYIDERMHALRPFNPHCALEISGGINRPPMERTEGGAALFRLARELAVPLGIELQETAVGGGSDGNFTAALAPTLDGLGALGDGAHASHEWIMVDELPRRTALLARLIEAIQRPIR